MKPTSETYQELSRIRIQARLDQALVVLGDLLEWDAEQGYHEAPCWRKARSLFRRASDGAIT